MQRSDQNPGGIIVLTEDSMPQLARCVADILREEFKVSSTSMKSSIPAGGADELISKARACEILDRCDSTLSKWAKRGILVPIRRHGSLYYRLGDVMKVYNSITENCKGDAQLFDRRLDARRRPQSQGMRTSSICPDMVIFQEGQADV